MTSGRATTHAQNKIIEINRAHRKKGLFIVELFSWEKIEDLLDEYTELADLLTKISPTQLTALGEKIDLGFRILSTQNEGIITVASSLAFDGDIDEAENCLKTPDPQRAQILLEKIRRRHWDRLTREQQYRVKAGLSNVALAQGKDIEAGRLLLEAKDLCPASERAMINEAIGLELLGKKREAHALASVLVESYSSAGKLIACLIRTAPNDTLLEAAVGMVSPATEEDADVSLALAIRAMAEQRFHEAESYAQRAVTGSPESYGPRFFLAQALLNGEVVKVGEVSHDVSVTIDKARLKLSVVTINEAIDLANKAQAFHCVSDCLLIRGLGHALLNEYTEAETDFQAAMHHETINPCIYYRYALFLFYQGRHDEAIATLRKMPGLIADDESVHFLADLLTERDKTGDLSEAIDIYIRIVLADEQVVPQNQKNVPVSKSAQVRSAALYSAIEGLINASRLEEAVGLIDRLHADRFGTACVLCTRSRIALAQGDHPIALSLIDEAIRHVSDDTSLLDQRAIAIHLGKLERHKDALPLWERINQKSGFGNDARYLVRCAERIKRYDVILSVAKKARDHGIFDPWLFYKEIEILDVFDVERAVYLLRKRIESHPLEKSARIRLTQIGLKWNRQELVDARAESLPTLEEATAEGGAFAVEVLRQHGDVNEALQYSYELIRRFFDDSNANASLIMVFFSPDSGTLTLTNPVEVGPGTAVRFAEGNVERWIVVEDSPNPRQERNEFHPSHPLAVAFIGRRVDDVVTISKTSGRDRTAIVKEVKNKYLFRLHEILFAWQLRFPDQPFIQMFHVGGTDPATGDETPDFTDLKLIADKRFEKVSEAENLYRNQLLPLHVFSKIAGCDPFRVVYIAALKPDLPVRCCRGQAEDRSASMERLMCCSTLVVDITALATISLLNLEKLLINWRGKFVISQTTATELRSVAEDLSSKSRGNGSYGKTARGYYFLEHSPEGMNAEAVAFAAFVQTVFDRCEVKSCPELAELEPDLRDMLVSVFGQGGTESMMLSRYPGTLLWTDDLTVRDTALREFSSCGVWTQIVVEQAAIEGIIPADDYLAASARLLGFDFEATMFNFLVVAKAGSISGWNSDRWPFNKALEKFAHPSVAEDQMVVLAAYIIVAMYKDVVLMEFRQATLIRIFERLAARKHGVILIQALLSVLPRLFGVNVLAANEVSAIGRAWLSEAHRRFRIEPDI